ncbi:MAG: hypothetical protein ABWZ16_07200 [Microbacterium sp.]
MTPAFDRRSMLRGSLTLAAAGLLTACAADETPESSATPSPTATTPSPTPTPGRVESSGRPVMASSYGANGTHYPDDLPWLGEAAALELIAECSWADIESAVRGLDAATVTEGVVIRVKPGTLTGNGSGSSSQPVLASVGDLSWTRNVLICPLEGFSSVTLDATGARLDQCARLSLFGMVSPGTLVMTQCAAMQVGWSRFNGLSITRGARGVALYELVLGFRQDENDTVGIRPIDELEMIDISRHGCVFGPSVKPAESGAHCDTMQLEGTGSGPFGPLLSVDCVDYGSSNAAELLHTQVTLADYQHCLILGGQLPWQVYPLRPGDYQGDPNAFAGGCQDVRLTECVVAGAVGKMGFTQVQNSTLSYTPVDKQQPSVSGAWSVDESIGGWDRATIMALQEIPDYEIPTLRSLWAW